jgi:hypothetical protein
MGFFILTPAHCLEFPGRDKRAKSCITPPLSRTALKNFDRPDAELRLIEMTHTTCDG